jgi:hypothetical protein
MNVGPIGLSNRVFDRYMIYFSVGVSTLSFVVEFDIRATSNCED